MNSSLFKPQPDSKLFSAPKCLVPVLNCKLFYAFLIVHPGVWLMITVDLLLIVLALKSRARDTAALCTCHWLPRGTRLDRLVRSTLES